MKITFDPALDLSDDEFVRVPFRHPVTGAELDGYWLEVYVRESERMRTFIDQQAIKAAARRARNAGGLEAPKLGRKAIAKALAHALKDCRVPLAVEGLAPNTLTADVAEELMYDAKTASLVLFGETAKWSLKTQIAVAYGDARFLEETDETEEMTSTSGNPSEISSGTREPSTADP